MNSKQIKAIKDYLDTHELCVGVGTKESACSIAAINLAMTGELTDKIPDCMSLVIGKWIISVQDSMPDSIRNSTRWKNLLPMAAGTGRDKEKERNAIIMNWMWTVTLPSIQHIADKYGFGGTWSEMCEKRTHAAADAAAHAARAAAAHAAHAARAARAAARAARAAAAAAHAARAAAHAAAADSWESFDPCSVLEKLINVSKGA